MAGPMSKIRCLVFDLDGTLYDIGNGYLKHIRRSIFEMMVKKGYAQSNEEAETIWRPLFRQYNQSFRGLNAGGYKLSADEYWSEHRSGMEKFFKPDPQLRELLVSLPHKKIIFTNCREQEADELLDILGIRDCFNATYGATFLGDICKPEEQCFHMLLAELGLQPHEILYFEDSVKNLRAASQLGMQCVLINSPTASEEGATISKMDDSHLCRIEGFQQPVTVLDTLNDGGQQLRAALPGLFEPARAL